MERFFNKNTKIACAIVSLVLVVCFLARATVFYIDKNAQQEAETDKVVTSDELNQETLQEIATTISEKSDELLAGGRDTFTILEIVPDLSYQTMGYLIGGKEPVGQEGMITLVNRELTNVQHLVGKTESEKMPITLVPNGLKLEYLENKTDYRDNVGPKRDNKWQRVRFAEAIDADAEDVPGYFEKVTEKNGLYAIEVLNSKFMPAKNGKGSYMPNIIKMVCRMDVPGTVNVNLADNYTGYDFTPVFEIKEGETQKGYIICQFSKNADGLYVMDFDNPNMSSFASMTSDEISVFLQNNPDTWTQLAFRLYDEDADADAGLQKYDVVFRYTEYSAGGTSGAVVPVFYDYDINNTYFEPGSGQYTAELKLNSEGEYYSRVVAGKNGLYNATVTDYKITMPTMNSNDYPVDCDKKFCWVFHPYDTSTMTGTPEPTLEGYEDGRFEVEDFKGVTTGGKNYKGYYCKDSFRNNEWFKLICLAAGGYVYDYTKSVKENLDLGKNYIRNYDRAHTIQILTETPNDVTLEMIENADLIYVNNTQPFENMTAVYKSIMGNTYVDKHGNTVTCGRDWPGDFTSFPIVAKMYTDAMLKERAVMLSVTLENNYAQRNCNLFKLYYMFTAFKNVHNFEYFFRSMWDPAEPRPGFNYLDETTGNVIVRMPPTNKYQGSTASCGEFRNRVLTGSDLTNYASAMAAATTPAQKAAVEQQYFNYLSQPYAQNAYWNDYDFKVSYGWGNEPPEFAWGNQNNSWVGNLADSERFLVTTWYTTGFFSNITNMHDIYTILHSDSYALALTNASFTSETDAVIYVDEFDDSYDIFYIINGEAVFYNLPVTEKLSIYVDVDGDGAIDALSTPVYVRDNPPLNENPDVMFYPGASWDAKPTMGTNNRMHFILVAEGYKEALSGIRKVPVKSTVSVQVIVRDLFDLD